MAKVIVGMSGGVDSAVAACLLKAAGMDVIGVTLRTWLGGENRCCKIDLARSVARMIDIPYHVLTCVRDFETHVTEPFVHEYLRGRTPNPCIGCNRYVKWEHMLRAAELMGADYLATGHFAIVRQCDNGRFTIAAAEDAKKDQSYMLCALTQAQLARTILPLGRLTKTEVRQIAAQMNLPVAKTPDSQEICFVTEGNYADYIEANAPDALPPSGEIVDTNGSVRGTHRGIIHYTVGQRRGLGIAAAEPLYVNQIDAEHNTVIVGNAASLLHAEVRCEDVHWMGIPGLAPGETIRADVKLRYRHPGAAATIEVQEDRSVRVTFDEPQRAPAPGQAAVFYNAQREILGSGIIAG